jgi:hypothetical protein
VDCVVFIPVSFEVFERITLDEAVRVVWLRFDVHAGYIEASAAVSFPGAPRAAEQVEQGRASVRTNQSSRRRARQ